MQNNNPPKSIFRVGPSHPVLSCSVQSREGRKKKKDCKTVNYLPPLLTMVLFKWASKAAKGSDWKAGCFNTELMKFVSATAIDFLLAW